MLVNYSQLSHVWIPAFPGMAASLPFCHSRDGENPVFMGKIDHNFNIWLQIVYRHVKIKVLFNNCPIWGKNSWSLLTLLLSGSSSEKHSKQVAETVSMMQFIIKSGEPRYHYTLRCAPNQYRHHPLPNKIQTRQPQANRHLRSTIHRVGGYY